MSDTLKERKIYRILTNASTKAWDKIAFWTTAKSVDAADGSNLETKVGAIKGITTSTSTTTKGYAADATVIKTLNDSLGGYKFTTKDGKIAYYKASAGADSAVPFSSGTDAHKIASFWYCKTADGLYPTKPPKEYNTELFTLGSDGYTLTAKSDMKLKLYVDQYQRYSGGNVSQYGIIINNSTIYASDAMGQYGADGTNLVIQEFNVKKNDTIKPHTNDNCGGCLLCMVLLIKVA